MQLAVNIAVLAAIYALIACGYVLVYRVSRVLNLAHGELMMLGAYMLMLTAAQFSAYWPAAIAAAVGLSLLTGVLVYLFLMRKMTGEMVLAAVLTTVALGVLLRGVMVLVWSAQQQYPAQALGVANTSIALPGGARISFFSALLILTTALVYGALLSFLRFGRWGIRMRAAGQSPLLAAQRGINLHAVYALAWGLSTLTGALAGILIALELGARPDHGHHRPQGVSGGVGGRARQLGWRTPRLADRRSGRGAADPLRRSAVVGGGAVPGADRHAGGASLGPVRHARGAGPCLDGRGRAATSAPAMRRI